MRTRWLAEMMAQWGARMRAISATAGREGQPYSFGQPNAEKEKAMGAGGAVGEGDDGQDVVKRHTRG